MSTTPRPTDRAPVPSDPHRTLPHSLEAEKGLLSSMILSPAGVIPGVADLPASALYFPAHQTVFQLLVDRWEAHQPADVITLTQALRDHGQLDAVGGPAFVTELFTFVPTAANADYYLDIIREKALRREIIADGTTLAAAGYDEAVPAEALREDFEQRAMRHHLAGPGAAGEDDPAAGIDAAVEELDRIWQGDPGAVGIPCGLAPLDKMLGGFKPGELIILAARPSVGKSALMMNIAEKVAVDHGRTVAVFSLEMTAAALRRRLLCSRARVNLERVRDKLASDEDFARLSAAAKEAKVARLFVDDTRGLSIGELRTRARRWHLRHGLDLIVIDYLQLLRSTSRQAQNSREREVADISVGLKGLAGELRVPILVCAQLNREMERAGRGPRLSDLRESGALEQDADVVLLLHRAEMQTQDPEERAELSGQAELIVAKQREGPTGPIALSFLKQFTRFEPRAYADG